MNKCFSCNLKGGRCDYSSIYPTVSPAPFKCFSHQVWGRVRGGGKRGEAAKIWVATDTGLAFPPMSVELTVREEAGHHPHVELCEV